jgi:hypothetical protein
MRTTHGFLSVALALAILTAPAASLAGTGAKCVPEVGVDFDKFQKAQSAALGVYEYLNGSDANVALVGRIGSDKSKRGILYTHAGLIFRNHPKGAWILTHLLRDCDSARSDLFDEGLFDFFNGSPFSYQALVVIPARRVQDRLEELNQGSMARRLHEPRYNTLANPFRTQFQNSNQWVLEMLATAIGAESAVTGREDAIRVLSQTGYEPARMKLKFKERVMVKAGGKTHVSLDDHRDSENRGRDGGYHWVSVESIVRYLEHNDLVLDKVELPLRIRD